MMSRRIIALLMAFTLLFAMNAASAEEIGTTPSEMTQETLYEIPDALYYTGGVVARGYFKDAVVDADGEPLQLAYVLTDDPYLIRDQVTTWELSISGGTGPYECLALLAYQEDLAMDPFEDGWSVYDYFDVTGDSFDYTFTEAGRYFWEFRLSDESGQFFYFQTRIYETYADDDQSDASTVVGKVNSIVSELINDEMSDYSRALVLHDWLIYNANYDYTFTYYDASGVLLHGMGVCDSYARAYLMLCTAAGLDCMYVSGTAGEAADPAEWGNHGWNLVKLNGSWYHVDCTWDDPGEGGYECHTYFCVDDETMAADHRWNTSEDVFDDGGMLVPDAEGGEYEYTEPSTGDYDFTFVTWEEFFAQFDAMVENGEHRAQTIGLYIGDLSSAEMYSSMSSYSSAKVQELANQGLITSAGRAYQGQLFIFSLGWAEPSAYVRIDETAFLMSIGEKKTLQPSEIALSEDVYVWASSNPSVAAVSYVWEAGSDVPITATITAVSAGTATITVTSPDGLSDSLTVTVLAAYQPDFALAASEADGVIALVWNGVPGVTEYRVMLGDDVLATVEDACAEISRKLLPLYGDQQLIVTGHRVINGSEMVSYTSAPVTIQGPAPVYASVLPEGTMEIGEEAFRGDVSLTSLSLPDGVTTIGASAFADCTNLLLIRIPASVTAIGAGAFDGSGLAYAQVVSGSAAEAWLKTNYPEVMLID